MPANVRVFDPDLGVELTTNEDFARSAGLTVLDKPAEDRFGRALPPKPRTTKSGAPIAPNVKEKNDA